MTIGGIKASILSWSDKAIKCVIPEGASTGSVVVYTDTWGSNSVRIEIE